MKNILSTEKLNISVSNLLSKCIFHEVVLNDARPACINQVDDNAAITQYLIVEAGEPTRLSSTCQLYTYIEQTCMQ